ncbi:MAG: AAA family ATPase, partial [Lentisphaerae bacterium]|nr:AAA family ATPase [Lentisphaerota bacterium]
REIIQGAQRRSSEYQQRTILFIDEVHRWNKAQQDALLPWVENGTVILIGATTENPYFTVNRALVSRSRIFQLKPLQDEDIRQIMLQALKDIERGYGKLSVELDQAALQHISSIANGDARAALNALELAVETTPADEQGVIRITLEVAEESIQRRAVLYDREGDYHFDTISAFIKSLRGSDPDAAFYWLAKMVYAGEDPRFIFRRMIIFASEDIGMADPHALPFVMAAAEAFDRVGLPEGHYPLSHAALYCATAPKSNSTMGFFDALKLVGEEREGEVPNHLRDASRDKEGFGHGQGYQYPHAYREHWVAQQYLPTSLQGKIFYQPGDIGYEKQLASDVLRRRELQLAALQENEGGLTPPEILTFSPLDKRTDRWLARAVEAWGNQLELQRDKLLEKAVLERHSLVLDLSADVPLLLWEELRRTPEGGVWALVKTAHAGQMIDEQAVNLPELRRPQILTGQVADLPALLTASGHSDLRLDCITGRNILSGCFERSALIAICKDLLLPGGRLCLLESIPRYGQRLSSLLESGEDWLRRVRAAEEKVYSNTEEPILSWDEQTLAQELEEAGFSTDIEMLACSREQLLVPAQLERWFAPTRGSYADRLQKAGLPEEDILRLRQSLPCGGTVHWQSPIALVKGALKL